MCGDVSSNLTLAQDDQPCVCGYQPHIQSHTVPEARSLRIKAQRRKNATHPFSMSVENEHGWLGEVAADLLVNARLEATSLVPVPMGQLCFIIDHSDAFDTAVTIVTPIRIGRLLRPRMNR